MFQTSRTAALALALLALAGLRAHAAEGGERPGTFNFVLENDRAANTDRHYTHGTYLSYVTGKGEVPEWLAELGDPLPLMESRVDRLGFVLGQTMFTPDDIGEFDLIEEDRPYAGYLYGGLKLYSEQLGPDGNDGLQVWELDVGVIGEESLADVTQDFVHDTINVQRPNGWDNQLATEPAVNLYYTRAWRFLADLDDDGHQAAIRTHARAALGNVHTYAGAGAAVVFGRNLRANWGPARIRPNAGGEDFFDVRRGGAGEDWHWSVFVGGQARAVARNIFLDGSTFEDSHSVEKHPVVGELQAGITIAWRRYQLGFTQVFRTREFVEQTESDVFGALTLSVNF